MPRSSGASQRRDTYRWYTLRPLNCLAFILPMLLFFQVAAQLYGSSLLATADLDRVLRYFGATTPYLPPLTVVLVLIFQHLFRKDPWTVQPKVLVGMFGESIVWMLPMIAMSYLPGLLLAHQALTGQQADQLLPKLQLGVGAAVYEEFIFRLILLSLIMLIFVDVMGLKKEVFALLAVLAGGVAFSLYHLSGAQLSGNSSFPWVEMLFRTVAGVYLGCLYVFRGFGVAVGAHAFYNVFVVLSKSM